MSQDPLFSPTTGTVSGLDLTDNYNAGLAALASANSGSSAPANTQSGTPVSGQLWLNTSGSGPTYPLNIFDGVQWETIGTINTSTGEFSPFLVLTGQCLLAYTNSSTITLLPKNGNKITIAGQTFSLAAGGITASPSGLTPGTVEYVYVFSNGGVPTLELSTTGHVTDTTLGNIGVEIKSGDNTRSLVGMVAAVSGPAFSPMQVLSWFNRGLKSDTTSFSAFRSSFSTGYVEINSEIRNSFLTWANQSVSAQISGAALNNTAGAVVATSLAFDGISPETCFTEGTVIAVNALVPIGIPYTKSGLSEGLHYVTLIGLVSAGTAEWTGGASSGPQTSLSVTVNG